jgi:cell division septal protein FtsQ
MTLQYDATQLPKELGGILAKISGIEGDAAHGSAWKSLRTAFDAVNSVGAIEKLPRMLDQYRSQLTLRLLLVLNVHQSTHGEKLDRLQEASKEIVEIISLNYRDQHPKESGGNSSGHLHG